MVGGMRCLNLVSHLCTRLGVVCEDHPQVGEFAVHMESFGLNFVRHRCTMLGVVLEDHPQVSELVHMESAKDQISQLLLQYARNLPRSRSR